MARTSKRRIQRNAVRPVGLQNQQTNTSDDMVAEETNTAQVDNTNNDVEMGAVQLANLHKRFRNHDTEERI